MEQPLQRLTQNDMLKEIRNAEREKRTANLSYKLLPEFSFSEKEISASLNLKGSTVQGAIYFENCKLEKDLILEETLIYRTLYIANSQIKGNLIAKQAHVREVVNLVASNFQKDIILEQASIKGFLGLNKVHIIGDLKANELLVTDISTKTGTIKGDIYLREADVKGSISFEKVTAEGLANLENSSIGEGLSFKDARFKGIVILSGTVIEGDVNTENLQCQKLIAHLV